MTIFNNIDFWSASSGFCGTIIIFFCGFPPQIDPHGHSYIILETEDLEEKKTAKRLKALSYLGLSLIGLSYLLQIIKVLH